MKTCIICTGVVWLALPVAIELNYYLALIAGWHAKWKLTIHNIYTKHIKLIQSKRKFIFYHLPHYICAHTWSITALTFETGDYILTYRGHLENKTGINSIGVWWYLCHEKYGKNNWYVWEVEISAASKLVILSQNLFCR